MKLLITNDDGIYAQGIQTLIKTMSSVAEIYVAAPDRERSGTGHSITVFEPIRAEQIEMPEVRVAWVIGGTPVDCVKLAVKKLIKTKIDLVVSGINHGPNLGTDILYSGTVAAAAEGVVLGIPSIAASLNSYSADADFTMAADITKELIEQILRQGIEETTLLNINIPPLPREHIKGSRITKLGIRNYDNLFEERKDPRGNAYFWLGGGVVIHRQEHNSDVTAVENGFLSITPIHLDLTDYRLMEKYRQDLDGFLCPDNISGLG